MIKRLLHRESSRHVLVLGMGTMLGQLAATLASPIWSRLYEPSDFGRYGLLISYLNIATVAVSFRYDLAIPGARDADESIRLVIVSLFCALPMSLLSGLIFAWLTTDKLFGFGRLPSSAALLVVLLVVLTGVYSTLRFWHVGNAGFRAISTGLVAQGVGRALTPIVLAPIHYGWLGLLAGELLGRALAIRRLAWPLIPLVSEVARKTSIRQLADLLKQYRRYPLVFLPSSILDSAAAAVAVPLVVSLFGIVVGGKFLLAQQIVTAPAALIGASLRDVIHAKLIPTARANPAELPKLVRRAALRLLLLAVVVNLPVACLAPVFAIPVFGRTWEDVGGFLSILSPAAVVSVAVSSVSRAMVLSRIPQIKFLADLIKLILPALGLIIGARCSGQSLRSALLWYSAMTAVSYALYFAIVMFSIQADKQLPMAKLKSGSEMAA